MRGINPDQLQALTTVVELGSFTAAAERLSLSQPAVSLQIRQLEERLGVRLVERLGKRAYATAPGRELIEHARRMARESEQALAAMRRYRDGWLGRVRIGTSAAAVTFLLPPVLRRLREEHPNIELVITTGTTGGVVERVLANAIDIGLVTLPVDDRSLDVTPLRDEALFAILPVGTPDIPDAVKPAYFASRTLILYHERASINRLIMDWLATDAPAARPAMELDSDEAIKSLVAAGLGASILPRMTIGRGDPGLAVRPLSPPLNRTIGLVSRRDKKDAALDHVRAALMTLAPA